MIELQSDELVFAFPELLEPLRERIRAWVDERLESATTDEKNRLPSSREEVHRAFTDCLPPISGAVSFQRTLRLPENSSDYPMPLGLGCFSPVPVEYFPRVPEAWRQRGGVMLPLYPTEALWLGFYADYPIALRIGMGGHCAVSGEPWAPGLNAAPQNYVVLGAQPWLDGFHAGPEIVRQFLAKPLGDGPAGATTVPGGETGTSLQLQAFPLRPEEFWRQSLKAQLASRWDELMTPIAHRVASAPPLAGAAPEWTIKNGGKIRLKILEDPYGQATWDVTRTSRCIAHLCHATDWQRLTGTRPPQKPPTAADFTAAGLPWADSSLGVLRPSGNSRQPFAHTPDPTALRPQVPDDHAVPPTSGDRVNPGLRVVVREF